MKNRFILFRPDDPQALVENQPDSTLEQTPPTDQPQDPPIDKSREYITALENTMREQNATIQRLLGQQNQPTPQAPAAPAPSKEELNQQFYNDPYNTTRNLIQEALDSTIKPLVETVRGLRFEGSPYDRMMSKFRNDPRFAIALQDQNVVNAIGQILENVELSEQSMQSAIVHAVGLKAMGQLGGLPAPTPTSTPQNPSPVIPPHVRPSAPPSPRNNENNRRVVREFTENERRIMREQGMTEEQYTKWLDMPASQVASANFDRPPVK